jgi:hypothetical protein
LLTDSWSLPVVSDWKAVLLKGKSKGHRRKGPDGELRYSSTLSLISALG